VRVTLNRDQRGAGAVLRLLHGEAPPLAGLGLGEVARWLDGTGLVMIAGTSGAGKTTTLAALVRTLGEKRRAVVTIEDPIEILHTHPSISQRAIGVHVRGVADGVAGAMREGVDAIAVDAIRSAESAAAVIDAVAGGHLVLATIDAPPSSAIARLLAFVGADHREHARALCESAVVGTIAPVVSRAGARTFEVSGRASAT
jgi:twitching motility protein PilT